MARGVRSGFRRRPSELSSSGAGPQYCDPNYDPKWDCTRPAARGHPVDSPGPEGALAQARRA
eukprot:4199329-Pyramimonas_sp.AAC.1